MQLCGRYWGLVCVAAAVTLSTAFAAVSHGQVMDRCVSHGSPETPPHSPSRPVSVRRIQPTSFHSTPHPPLYVKRGSVQARALAGLAATSTGGVDMRNIDINQVELQPCDPNLEDCQELTWKFRIELPPALDLDEENNTSSVVALESTGRAGSPSQHTLDSTGNSPDSHRPTPPVSDDAFGHNLRQALFVWLHLPHDAFFVNLKPNEPNRVLDARMAQTEVGRILLEADYFLKNVTSYMLHPATDTGNAFWQTVFEPPPAETCVSFRQWIVPLQSTVVQTDTHLYVVEAPLEVQEEAEYVQFIHADGEAIRGGCDQSGQNPEVLAAGNAFFREHILHHVADAINNAEVFKELRYIFYWRVIAEWFAREHPNAFPNLGPQDYVAWTEEAGTAFVRLSFHVLFEMSEGCMLVANRYARHVWKLYAQSNAEGMYQATKLIRHDGKLYRRSYSHGGIDLGNIQTVHATIAT